MMDGMIETPKGLLVIVLEAPIFTIATKSAPYAASKRCANIISPRMLNHESNLRVRIRTRRVFANRPYIYGPGQNMLSPPTRMIINLITDLE
jgi:hypothetical protein